MTPQLLSRIIYESAMYHLQILMELEQMKLDALHRICEDEHLRERMYWVKYGK